MSKKYFKAYQDSHPIENNKFMCVSFAEWRAIRRLDRMLAKATSGEMDVFRAYQEWQKVRES